ncbi:MAG TPA: nuclear transport factor 2 family protein [Hyphomonadaceae bacterium]
MPTMQRVRDFITRVESRDYIGALVDFYHEDVVVQENLGQERRGRDALIAHEIDIANRFGSVPVRKVERFAVNGDCVFINWIFELKGKDGAIRVLDEVTMQIWRDDRIASERFYYDPAMTRG